MRIKNYLPAAGRRIIRITSFKFCLIVSLLLSTFNLQLLTASDKLDVIVLDAGHGGKDPGTIGISGIKEKDIVLPITLKLADLISKRFPEIKVILTRKSDIFPELKERPIIANQNKAKLFISIHANFKKAEENEKQGFEIYTLSRERFPEAVQVTIKENAWLNAERSGNDSETDYFIFSTLSQSGYLKQAEALSSQIETELSSATPLESRGCLNAGFWVILAPSMPSVLVETGYLSNSEDEKYLSSERGQNEVANALFDAFVRYKIYYEM